MPSLSAEEAPRLKPYMALALHLGAMAGQLTAARRGHHVTLLERGNRLGGHELEQHVEVGVPGTWTVDQTRPVEDLIRERVGAKVRGVRKVRVRFVTNSTGEPDFLDEFIAGDVSGTATPEAEHDHSHDHDHAHEHEHDTTRRRK